MNKNVSDPHSSKITLADGSVIELGDWVYGSFRAAGVIAPYGDALAQLELFSNGRSQQLPGAPAGEMATTAHTNIPRSGDNGLPRGWQMVLYGWRAQCSLALEQEVVDFASTCMVEFQYNAKAYRDCTLAELLLSGSEMTTATPAEGGLPLFMKESLSYKVSIVPQNASAVEKFQAYLRSKAPGSADPTVIAELEQLARLAGGNVGSEIKRIQQKLQPGVRATFWVNLDGYIKRTMV